MFVLKRIKAMLIKNETLQELLLGIAATGFLMAALLFLFTKRKVYYGAGALVGVLVAAILAIHLAYTLDDSLGLPEKAATADIRKETIIRYVFTCVVVAVIGITDILSPVTCIFGIFTLKFGAYLQPLVLRILGRYNKSEPAEEDSANTSEGGE